MNDSFNIYFVPFAHAEAAVFWGNDHGPVSCDHRWFLKDTADKQLPNTRSISTKEY